MIYLSMFILEYALIISPPPSKRVSFATRTDREEVHSLFSDTRTQRCSGLDRGRGQLDLIIESHGPISSHSR